jgi:hypothetical protein
VQQGHSDIVATLLITLHVYTHVTLRRVSLYGRASRISNHAYCKALYNSVTPSKPGGSQQSSHVYSSPVRMFVLETLVVGSSPTSLRLWCRSAGTVCSSVGRAKLKQLPPAPPFSFAICETAKVKGKTHNSVSASLVARTMNSFETCYHSYSYAIDFAEDTVGCHCCMHTYCGLPWHAAESQAQLRAGKMRPSSYLMALKSDVEESWFHICV